MREMRTTGQFDRDYALAKKRGKDLTKLDAIMLMLIRGENLPSRHHDHPLKGNFKGYRDCHIESDWLLIYKIEGEVITFARTGTHADIF